MFSHAWLCFLLFQFWVFAFVPTSTTADTLSPTESITDGQFVISAGGNFELGFFNPGNSLQRYIGIWFHKIPETTVVWVANRDNPINDSSGVLSIAQDGNLIVTSRSDQRRLLWSTNVSVGSNTTFLQLQNTGNLVLYSGSDRNEILWQSFDHPTNEWLSGMKLGLDRRTNLNRILTSWKSKDDPGRGIYSYGFDPRGSPQLFLYKGSNPVWRGGPWNGQRFSGVPEMNQSHLYSYEFVNNTDEFYFIYNLYNSSIFTTVVLNDAGTAQQVTWIDSNRQWSSFFSAPRDGCDYYGYCGAYGSCRMVVSPVCICLPGFQPKSPRYPYLTVWSDGCVRKRSLGCGKGDGFLKLVGVKLPDTSMSLVDNNLSLEECKQECLNNCSCTAYAPADITGGGSGCVAWFGSLIDIRYFTEGGQDLYLRVDAVELAAQTSKNQGFLHNKGKVAILTVSLVVGALLIAACVYSLLKKRKGAIEKRQKQQPRNQFLFDFTTSSTSPSYNNISRMNELQNNGTNPKLPFIEVDVVRAATDNFSPNNKLGEGGFGAVYKGRLCNGKEIAVKRLSKNSGQGMEEFKNEVLLIARLQHRNLVRLLACSGQEEEKMLIYEYMPNKSLDFFIFDESKRALLDWRKRYKIIVGIARGVLYLHQDSRFRIIHRDLKASNVLLDEEMNPKISDFGLARIFGGNQIQANTNKVVGTYGYMSPEYAMQGLFSIKSDVFSFGVLLLEIISGKKNNLYSHEDPSTNLIEHVWDLWKEGQALEIIDSSMGDFYPAHEILRCIQVGLLCVQESPSDRPTMSNVTFMLENETKMPMPNQPALIIKRTINGQNSSASINEMTITMVDPR